MKVTVGKLKIIYNFIKNNLGSCLSWAITFAWLIFIYLKIKNGTLPSSLNEFGDFVAGAFAPLAFFWLVRGFYQQGKGLKQNSEALNIQAQELQKSSQALALQATELKSTADGQKQLVKLATDEMVQRHFQNEPNLVVKLSEFKTKDVDFPIFDNNDEQVNEVTVEIGSFSLLIEIKSNEARRIQVDDIKSGGILKSVFQAEVGECITIDFEYMGEDLDSINSGNKFTKNITINYADVLGKFYKKNFHIEVNKNMKFNYVFVSLHPVIGFI
jgi:hypothetical protein